MNIRLTPSTAPSSRCRIRYGAECWRSCSAEHHQKRVTELAEPFDISLNAVSKHIRILEGARLVTRRVEGRDHWIAANPGPLLAATSWMEKQAKFWSPRLQALAKLVEKQ